ncbi:hypothetical protein PROVRETT_06324 [Providencia rettgeri DSM 1131]|nr:hypothetical protein PROVRETT_06324 [Providencia rettgeri DSM 1131]
MVVPLAIAANNSARFETLFDPGKLIVPLIEEIGCNVRDCIKSSFSSEVLQVNNIWLHFLLSQIRRAQITD